MVLAGTLYVLFCLRGKRRRCTRLPAPSPGTPCRLGHLVMEGVLVLLPFCRTSVEAQLFHHLHVGIRHLGAHGEVRSSPQGSLVV